MDIASLSYTHWETELRQRLITLPILDALDKQTVSDRAWLVRLCLNLGMVKHLQQSFDSDTLQCITHALNGDKCSPRLAMYWNSTHRKHIVAHRSGHKKFIELETQKNNHLKRNVKRIKDNFLIVQYSCHDVWLLDVAFRSEYAGDQGRKFDDNGRQNLIQISFSPTMLKVDNDIVFETVIFNALWRSKFGFSNRLGKTMVFLWVKSYTLLWPLPLGRLLDEPEGIGAMHAITREKLADATLVDPTTHEWATEENIKQVAVLYVLRPASS
ncbi:hypothetical protein KPG66_12565 [Mycetohabitans sp. B2]|uniref:hypothetical protein n=1 Tax=Mycetohabitans sp. B2 TaxID=2841274 RepID=UPI001F169903|nr:hypothetical protein [Mycetohabitans sp. B2]MCF7696893.1 hypothetical protein [Mycetohabitans sp. B2]